MPWLELILAITGVFALASSVKFFFPALAEGGGGWFIPPVQQLPPKAPAASEVSRDIYHLLVEEFFQESRIGGLFFGEDLRLRAINGHSKVLLNDYLKDGMGKYCNDILPPTYAQAVRDCWRDKLNGNVDPITLTSSGEQKATITGRVMLLRDVQEVAFGVSLFLWKKSEGLLSPEISKAQAEELAHYKHMASVGVHAAGVAHEIKNPLVALKTFGELLPTRYDDPDFRHNFSKVALKQIQRIDGMVGDLLHYASPRKLELRSGSPLQILQEVLEILAIPLKGSKIHVRQTNFKELYPLQIDAEKMRRVFLNIVLNAMEAMPNGGRLTVTSRLKPRAGRGGDSVRGQLEICIEDTGVGISAEELEKIFEPFYSTKRKGSGLGLAISKKIMLEHGGAIEYRSGSEGTACYLRLPVEEEPQEVSVAVKRARNMGKRAKDK